MVDIKRRVVTFSVHAQSPFTYAQPIYEPMPVRLAALGYNSTVFTLLPFPEDEIAHVAIEQAIQVYFVYNILLYRFSLHCIGL